MIPINPHIIQAQNLCLEAGKIYNALDDLLCRNGIYTGLPEGIERLPEHIRGSARESYSKVLELREQGRKEYWRSAILL